MLNTVLTVQSGKANSHAKKGWEQFTDATVRRISAEREGVVFLLWGKHAQNKKALIASDRDHVILEAPHPSGLSAHRGFFGCKHFSQTNEALKRHNVPEIQW